jgi:hypothetical protein
MGMKRTSLLRLATIITANSATSRAALTGVLILCLSALGGCSGMVPTSSEIKQDNLENRAA